MNHTNNIDRFVETVKKQMIKNISNSFTVEQYLFAFSNTVVVITTDAQVEPFYVMNFDNVNKLSNLKRFDDRISAHKEASSRWLYGM